jgi:hypothetical protein
MRIFPECMKAMPRTLSPEAFSTTWTAFGPETWELNQSSTSETAS